MYVSIYHNEGRLFRFNSSLELKLLPQFLDHRESMTSNGYIILCLGKHIWIFKCKCISKISTCITGGPNKSNWRKYSTESCVVKFLLDLGKHFFIFPLLTNAFHILKYLYYLRCTFFCCCIITRKVNKDQAFQYVCVVCYTENPTRWIEKFRKIYIMRDFFLRSLKLIEISDMRGVRFLSNLKGIFCIKKFWNMH